MSISTGYTVDTGNARIYSDMDTGVWLAVAKTPGPEDLGPPGALFSAAGWLGEEGISLAIDKEIADFNALQGGSLIRRKVTKVTQKFTFVCLEETALVLGLAYADQPITVTGTGTSTIAKHSISKDQAKTVVRSIVVDAQDGDVLDRYTVEEADITYTGTVNIANNELRAYTFEATILAGTDAFHLTNSPGVAVEAP